MKVQIAIDNFFSWLNTPSNKWYESVAKNLIVLGSLLALVLITGYVE